MATTTGQIRWTIDGVREIVARVRYEKRYRVGAMGDGFYVQIEYEEPDIRSGDLEVQRGRKWYVSAYATESEIIQTMLTAALASAEHQVREHFAYTPPGETKAKLIYGPHFHADALWGICGKASSYDAREDPE
jgi:hypothetical protein